VKVATGDVDGDGLDEVVTGAGQPGGPHVRIWKVGLLDNTTVKWTHQLLRDYFAFAAAFNGGVRVACGDVDGDGHADIITAMGPGSYPYVSTQSGATGMGIPGASYFPYALDFTGGVYVSAADLDGDGRAEIITGAGDGGARHIRAYNVAMRSYLVDRVEPGLATGVEVAALPHPRRNGTQNRGGILYAQPASQYFSFRPITSETAGSAAPWAVNAGAEMVINDLTPIRQSLAAYQVPGKPPHIFDFTSLEPTLEMMAITPRKSAIAFRP
jgi:hypothetical protein